MASVVASVSVVVAVVPVVGVVAVDAVVAVGDEVDSTTYEKVTVVIVPAIFAPVIVTLIEDVAAEGVPEMKPVVELNVIPLGREPAVKV